jgi:DNA repair photolyase
MVFVLAKAYCANSELQVNFITDFDPWQSRLCTCPAKLTFNPYTGCDHACVYCYASSYIPRFFDCRPKKDLIQRLTKEAAKLKGELISIANSSDPYPTLEAETGLTRQCLEVLTRHDCKIQIITKNSLVTRDIDLLQRVPSTVAVTITTDNEELARRMETHASPPSERLAAVKTLIGKGIPTSVRIDPVIPHVNDNPESLMQTLASIGVKHITSSTYKVKPDNWQRFRTAMPETAEKLKSLYFDQGEKIGGYLCLPRELRVRTMERIGASAARYGMKFGACREGFTHLNTATCDGSWLLHSKTTA